MRRSTLSTKLFAAALRYPQRITALTEQMPSMDPAILELVLALPVAYGAVQAMRTVGASNVPASLQAAVRAEKSRDADNILKFCHWRQVERLIGALAADEPQGTVH